SRRGNENGVDGIVAEEIRDGGVGFQASLLGKLLARRGGVGDRQRLGISALGEPTGVFRANAAEADDADGNSLHCGIVVPLVACCQCCGGASSTLRQSDSGTDWADSFQSGANSENGNFRAMSQLAGRRTVKHVAPEAVA